MTPEQLKELAEESAEFLGLEKHLNIKNAWKFQVLQENLTLYPFDFFDDSMPVAPILMHLAQEKLDKNNNLTYECGSIRVDGKLMKTCSIYQNIPDDEFRQIDSNKFIAFWKAVEATGVLDANE